MVLYVNYISNIIGMDHLVITYCLRCWIFSLGLWIEKRKVFIWLGLTVVFSEMMGKRHEELIYFRNLVGSFLGSLVGPFLSIFYFNVVGRSFLNLSYVSVLPSFISTILSLFWAFLADSYGRYKPFIVCSSFLGSVITFMLSFVNSFNDLLMIRIIGSIVGSMGSSTFPAFLSKLFDKDRERRIGLYMTFGIIGGFVGNLISGFLYDTYGIRVVLRFLSVAQLVPALIIIFIDERVEKKNRVGRGLFSLFMDKTFIRVFAAKSLIVIPSVLCGGLVSVYFIEYLHGSSNLWALTTAVSSVMSASALIYGKIGSKIGDERLLLLSGLGWGVLYLCFGLVDNPILFSLVFIIPVWPAFNIGYQALLMKLSDRGSRASLYSIESLLSAFYSALMGILAGYFAEVFSPRPLFILSGLIAFVSTLLAWCIVLRDLRF